MLFRSNDTYKFYRERVVEIPKEHNTDNKKAALDLWQTPGKVYLGTFFKHLRPEMTEQTAKLSQAVQARTGKGNTEKLLELFV